MEVIRRLLRTRVSRRACAFADFGIRGYDLAYALLDGYDVTILVDAAPRRTLPGRST